MSKDLSKSLTGPETSYHIRNYKLTTDNKGLSSVSLTSESGNVISFKLPENIIGAEYEDEDGNILETVPNLAGEDLIIIGVTTLLDDIVLFTTDPNGIGQIWWIKYDYVQDKVIGLTGTGELTQADHLIYNRYLNFSASHRIKAVAKYETAGIIRVYWTDFFNPVRSLNMMSPNIEPGLLDIKPIVNMSQPNVLEVGAGSLPAGTMVQFTYRLLDNNGNLTTFAPFSELYPLPKSGLLSDDWIDISGDGDPSVDETKSVTYEIKGVDTNFDYIEHVIVIYTEPDVYTAYSFADRLVPADGYVKLTCSSVLDAVIIDPVELNMLSSAFDIAKDIEIKDDRLIAINTKSTPFDINFDARAYRFDNTQQSVIYEEDGSSRTIDGTAASIAYPTLNIIAGVNEAELDCINLYNDEDDPNWGTNRQYKYKADGSTLGGEGPRISYEFTTRDILADYTDFSSITTAPPHVTSGRWGTTSGPEWLGVRERNGTPRNIIKASHFKDNNSGYNPAYYRGYARGETYRFGIVFYSKSNQPSFVKWIGDIRFPEPCEIGHEGVYPVMSIQTAPFESMLRSLGIEFTIDISGFEDVISGFEIVRVQRMEGDKTRFGTGMLMGFTSVGTGTLISDWEVANDGGFGTSLTDDVDIYGALENGNEFCLRDMPAQGADYRLRFLISPINQEYELIQSDSDFIKTYGYYESKPQLYHNLAAGLDINDTWGFYYRLKDYVDIVTAGHGQEYFEVSKATLARVGEYFESSSDIVNGLAGVDSVRNASVCTDILLGDKGTPLGLGSQKTFLRLNDTPTLSNCIDPVLNESWMPFAAMAFVGNTGTDRYFKEVAYCRYLANQYGGNSYVARQSNKYISTGNFQPVDSDVIAITTTTINNTIYGGDVFVNYFDDEYIQMYQNTETAYKEPYNDPHDMKLSVAAMCPVESHVNTDFITGERWASDRDSANMSAYENNSYEYNFVFSQESNTEQKFFAKDALITINDEHRHRVWASEQKTDGELIDNWRQFKAGNSIEVNGTHGPLNRVINFRDNMFFYQDKAFGVLAVDKEAVVPDEFGVELTLGRGRVLDFQYISQTTGAFHQWGVIASEGGLYHFDARLKQLYRYSQGLEALTFSKGFTSHFSRYDGEMLVKDETILGTGVETVWDNKNNRVLFTFLNHKKLSSVPAGEPLEFREGDIFIKDGSYFIVDDYSSHFRSIFEDYEPSEINGVLQNDYILGETISYSEAFDCFEAFYDYKPSLYINTNRALFSVSPFNFKNEVWLHNSKDVFNTYYGFTYPYEVEVVLMTQDGVVNIFNNVEYQDECFNAYGKDLWDRSFNKYKARNEYQNTNYVDLIDGENYKRRMRMSSFWIGRDFVDGESRMRSPWLRLKLLLDNHDGSYRHVLHNILYSFNISNH